MLHLPSQGRGMGRCLESADGNQNSKGGGGGGGGGGVGSTRCIPDTSLSSPE